MQYDAFEAHRAFLSAFELERTEAILSLELSACFHHTPDPLFGNFDLTSAPEFIDNHPVQVLAVCIPASGHEFPLIPLLEAFVSGGDRVVLATGQGAGNAANAVGAELTGVGHGLASWFETLGSRTKGQPGDGIRPERINHYFVGRLFGEIATADMVDEVVAVGRDIEADLVLFDGACFAGPLAANILGVPAVHHMITPQLADDVIELANDAVSPLWRKYGLDAPFHAGLYDGTTIQICPPSLETLAPAGGTTLRMRPVPAPTGPGAATHDDEPPLVYATLGTLMANMDVFKMFIDGLADEPMRVVMTIGAENDPAELGPLPANVRVERFAPQAALLPDCAAVVHHGGAGTMFGALAHGLPQVIVPQGADNFDNADLLSRNDIGMVVTPGEVTPDTVRQAVRAILEDPAYANAAGQVAAEIASMPDAAETAEQLRSLVASS